VTTDNTPLFCSTALAERIERVEAQLIRAATDAAGHRTGDAAVVIPVAGGAACFAEDGSPMNKVVGLGFGGVPAGGELDEIEKAYSARSAPTQVELSNLGDPEIAAELTSRGYQLVSFENVLGRSLTDHLQPVTPEGVEVRKSGDRARTSSSRCADRAAVHATRRRRTSRV
jgi:hypothetical protein